MEYVIWYFGGSHLEYAIVLVLVVVIWSMLWYFVFGSVICTKFRSPELRVTHCLVLRKRENGY